MVGLYKVVPPDEAHVRIMGNSKEVFMSRKYVGQQKKSDYWIIPFITKVTRLPLTNIRIDVPDIKLNDSNMAKFSCDIVCFVNIIDPILCAERTGITVEEMRYEGKNRGIEDLSRDFQAIMESIGRTVATKQTIIDIYKDRNKLDEAVTIEIKKVFPQWGIELVDLEIKDIKDTQGSTIIQDIEKKQASEINADARVKIAIESRRADISEAENKRDSELKKAETEETYRKRQIEKDQIIAIAQQEKNKLESQKKKEANETEIEATRVFEVGTADVQKQAIIKKAEAEKEKLSITAEGEASQIKKKGTAEADIIKLKKVAEAEGTERLAEAQQKFNETATTIEVIKATKEVQIALATAYQKAFENADINIVAGSTQEIISGGVLGNVKIGAKEGVAMEQFLSVNPALKELLDKLSNKTSEKEKK